MRLRILPAAALWFSILLSGCAGSQDRDGIEPWASQAALDSWIKETLTPYLVKQLGHHPRFNGQPFLLVRMQGGDVQPNIDDLTDHIREMIIDALLKEPGVDLAWRPGIPPWKHHQSLEDISCGAYRKIRYYVGIDCGLTGVDRKLYVKVRALNLAEKKWVSGFGRSWRGKPTPAQLAALNREHPDHYLRGLRPLPFSDGQPDLLAAYLAHNLSCLLRQGETDDLVVYVENAATNAPHVFQSSLDLVGKYLTRFREVEVTDDPSQASVTVVAAVHPIHQNLYQIWLSAKHHLGKKYLSGAGTEAYVLVDSQKPSPVVSPLPALPSTSTISQHRPWMTKSLISSFDLLTPSNPEFCATQNPWIIGARKLRSNEHLPSSSCLAVELSLSKAAYVFIVSQNADGDLTRIFPSECPAFRGIDAQIPPGKQFQFPPMSDPQSDILALDDSPGMERVYAIAITAPDLADGFALRLEQIQGLCRPDKSFVNSSFANDARLSDEQFQRWQRYLTQLAAQHPGMLQWREIRFWHDPPSLP
jgi:hypothetical protein